jgi:hypothetical protein
MMFGLKVVPGVLVLVVVGLCFAAPVYSDGADGQESQVVTYVTQELRDKCTECHSIGRVLAYRLDHAEWTSVVWLRMRPKMPEMFGTYDEAEPMIDFLAGRYDFLAQMD